ncbi:hypothetical protein TNCV_4594431 [Trichonephila clavipes]|uniref:Uncharacterized protein n=1 Tax=Trichonephila clavipes TaxID=2585209 RepID=A0A8X6WGV1_TRICX|nr:hypothetical protein TNCV_4594431 [Trichonephila clavipes]
MDTNRRAYRNRPQRNNVNQFENRNHNDRNDHRFENRGGRNQFGNRGLSDIFNRGDRRHGGRLNCLKVRFDQGDQSQIEADPPIRIAALRMPPVDLPYVPILLNETFTKPLWDTGAEKSFISEDIYKKCFFFFFASWLRSHMPRS